MGTRSHPIVPNHAYFITSATAGRKRLFSSPRACRLLVSTLYELRSELGFLLLAFVVMPDHVHLLIVPSADDTIGRVMQATKGRFARKWNAANGTAGTVWQRRYFESTARTHPQLFKWVEYIHGNPVRAGLARTPEEYPYSSAAPNMQTDLDVYLGGTPGQAKARPSGDGGSSAAAESSQAKAQPSGDKGEWRTR